MDVRHTGAGVKIHHNGIVKMHLVFVYVVGYPNHAWRNQNNEIFKQLNFALDPLWYRKTLVEFQRN